MILVVGLGNPGKKFKKTRHNLGFRVVDEFHRKNKEVKNFSNFKLQNELRSFISGGKFNQKKIILAKPQTFMNLSGKSVKKLISNLKIPACHRLERRQLAGRQISNLWVIHDDLDLPLGKIRISKGRGAAGHKGVESIIREIGTKNFVRFRIGIQPETGKPKNPEKFVLQKFNKAEEKIVKEVIKKTATAIEINLKEGLGKAMNKFN